LKAILFDLDGTLSDPYEGIRNSIEFALSGLNIAIPVDLRWCIGPPLKDSFSVLLKGHEHTPDEAIDLYRQHYSEKGMFQNQIYEGIPELLETMSAIASLYVATSKPHVYATKILNHFNLNRFFKKIYGAELDGTRSEKGNLISSILENEALDPKNVLMIGDRRYDIIGAKKNNIRSIGVTWGFGSKVELESQSPNAIIDTPEELINFIYS